MCAALTVPIIKDGYRLYPGMPVNGDRRGANRSTAGQKIPKGRNSQHSLSMVHGRLSPPDSASASGSPPGNNTLHVRGQHQILLQPRVRTTSNQSQISARSSFEMAPSTIRPDLIRGRSAMSTSQLYMQQRRELAIQQQLRRQELAKKQQQQQQHNAKNRKASPAPPPLAQRSDSNGNESCITDYDAEDSLNFCDDNQSRSRKGSAGDQNNNKDPSGTNPLRKLLKRLGLGSQQQQNHHRSEANSFSEGSIEQAVPALHEHLSKPELGVAVAARQ